MNKVVKEDQNFKYAFYNEDSRLQAIHGAIAC